MTARLYQIVADDPPSRRAAQLLSELQAHPGGEESWRIGMEILALVPDLLDELGGERAARNMWEAQARAKYRSEEGL